MLATAVLLGGPSAAARAGGQAPSIDSESVSNITEQDATLQAQINPGGHYTGYEFQIDTTGSFDFRGPACPFELPGFMQCYAILASGETMPGGVEPKPQYLTGGEGDQTVSLDLASIGVVLEPSTTYHYRVIADDGYGTVQGPGQTFTTPPGEAVPSIDGESVSNVGEQDATLEAQIDPNGLQTTYEFHLISPACQSEWPIVGPCMAISTFTLPSGTIAAGHGDQTVSLDLNSAGVILQPDTGYEYSVTASNADGSAVVTSARRIFKTTERSAASGPPSIDSESVSNITEQDATLQAQINPHGAYTGYEFQVDTTGSFDFSGPACPFALPGSAQCMAEIAGGETMPGGVEPKPQYIPAGEGDQSVSLDLASTGVRLQGGTTYHYRVIADNGDGGVQDGPDQTFTTPGQPGAQPLDQTTVSGSVNSTGTPGNARSVDLASKLGRALKLCEHKPKRQRVRCERLATRSHRLAKFADKRQRKIR